MNLCESTAFLTACSTLLSVGKFPNTVGSPEENKERRKQSDQTLEPNMGVNTTTRQQKWLNKYFTADSHVKRKSMAKLFDAFKMRCTFYSLDIVLRYFNVLFSMYYVLFCLIRRFWFILQYITAALTIVWAVIQTPMH